MRTKLVLLMLPVAILALISYGCTGGNSAVTPLVPIQPGGNAGSAQDVMSSGHNLLSFQLVYVDPSTMMYEVAPARGLETHYNVLSWLETKPCTTCFSVTSIGPSGTGTLLVGIQVTHPFSNLNLTGFDARAIAMFRGSHVFTASGLTASDRALGDPVLVNADGYTALYNVATSGSGPNGLQGYIQGKLTGGPTPATKLNGYKRLISVGASNTRNALLAGDSVASTFEIDKPAGPFIFGYAVDASWAPPTIKPVVDPMTDFGPEANSPEPWKVAVTEQKVGDGLTTKGGQTSLLIDVYDWQGKTSYAAPVVEVPELFTGSVTAVWSQDFTGYSRYQATVGNTKLAATGTYLCLVKVVDSANTGSPAWLDLTAYQIVKLDVATAITLPPIALATANPLTQTAGSPVHFQDNGSYDPDGGTITKYEWDWDNNGTWDQLGASVDHTFASAGTYPVQFRVTDSDGLTGTLSTPLSITVNAAASVTWTNSIKGMLNTSCGSCHVQSSAGGVSFKTYTSTMQVVVPGAPMSSLLYTNIYQGNHDGHLSPANLTILYNWILNGAPEN
jgi:PKD repeat protein